MLWPRDIKMKRMNKNAAIALKSIYSESHISLLGFVDILKFNCGHQEISYFCFVLSFKGSSFFLCYNK